MDIEAFRSRAKLAEDQIAELESTIQQLIKTKCGKYRYEVVYYGMKNRGNFARLLFAEAGIPFDDISDIHKVMSRFKCRGKLSRKIKIDSQLIYLHLLLLSDIHVIHHQMKIL